MSPIGDGLPAALAILAGAVLPTEVWRWLGLMVGRRIDPDSEALHWVRAVATAIIAAFVGRLVIFPTGSLAEVPLALRIGAMAAGVVVCWASRGVVVLGVFAAIATLVTGQWLRS